MPDLDPNRSRGSSTARQDGYTSDSSRYSQRSKPINEAINSAFNATHAADQGIPPELLERLTSQITANVIKELKSSNLQSASSNPSHAADNGSSTGGSPPMGRASVYTPPSPNRAADEFPQPSPRKSDRASPPPDRRTSPFSPSEHAEDSDAREGHQLRPKAPTRVSTTGDMTVLEKIWGKLFLANGEPTPRLGQFLRGIAVHLIEDYEPKYSLVLTPAKMQQFYLDTKVTNEIYPWQVVFDDRTSSISRMFRDLGAQHHLVQYNVNDRPDTPGLTPQGFETWATLLIKAHPEQEFERLAKTAMNMPIDNADERKERFPKELTRRLLPKQADEAVAAQLRKSMSVHCNVTFKARTESTASARIDRSDDATPLAAGVPKSSQDSITGQQPVITPVTSNSSSTTRETKPQSFSSNAEAVIDSEEENAPTPQPIERERKPYVAQAGGGKDYGSVDMNYAATTEIKPALTASDNIRPPAGQDMKLGRSQSTRSYAHDRPRPVPISVHQPTGTAPIEVPESRNHRTSRYRPETRRTRSPSMSKDNAASSSRLDAHDTYNTFAHPSSASATADGSFPERDRRYRDYESARRERFPEDRYDSARMSAYDPRERDRDRDRVDTRPRGQSIAVGLGVDQGRAEDEYYRRDGGYPAPTAHSAAGGFERPSVSGGPVYGGNYQPPSVAGGGGGNGVYYPPSAYRDGR